MEELDMEGSMEADMNNDADFDSIHSGEMEECIQICLRTYRTCQETFFYCLQQGGAHHGLSHLQIMQSCAEVCRTSAQLMMLHSPFHHYLSKVCAEICKACAESCEIMKDEEMQECARQCRECAESCEMMSQMAKSKAV
ncbi:MAG: four-helix bundle copper-binding protein [Bdellovibrionota bacterium]